MGKPRNNCKEEIYLSDYMTVYVTDCPFYAFSKEELNYDDLFQRDARHRKELVLAFDANGSTWIVYPDSTIASLVLNAGQTRLQSLELLAYKATESLILMF